MKTFISLLVAAITAACAPAVTVPDTGAATAGSSTAERGDPGQAAPSERQFEIDHFRHSLRLRDGGAISFVNEYGDLRMRKSRDGGVHYAAVIQKLDGEQRDPVFGPNRRSGVLVYAVDAPADWIGRVDASARVPPSSALELRTLDGLIEVRAGGINASAETRGGAIKYRGSGTVDARSQTGNVHLSLDAGERGARTSSVATGGDVELWLASNASVIVHCKAGTEIVNNVAADAAGVTLERDGATTFRLGNGDSRVDVDAGGKIVVGVLDVGR